MFMTLEILSWLDKDEKCLQGRGLSGGKNVRREGRIGREKD